MSKDRDRWDARRWGVLLLALVQLAGPIGLQVVDAALDGEDYSTPVHIEGEGQEECADGHGHLICQTLRSMADGIGATDALKVGGVSGPESAVNSGLTSSFILKTPVSGTLGSRAPPLA